MSPETKKIILAALDRYRGDDFERASHAFRGLSPDAMQRQYGQSGRTCQEILDGYRRHVEAIAAARAELDR